MAKRISHNPSKKIVGNPNCFAQPDVELIPSFGNKTRAEHHHLRNLNNSLNDVSVTFVPPDCRERNPLVLEADPRECPHKKYNYEYRRQNSNRNLQSSTAAPVQRKKRTPIPQSSEQVYRPHVHHVEHRVNSPEQKFKPTVHLTEYSSKMKEGHILDPPEYKRHPSIKPNSKRTEETVEAPFKPHVKSFSPVEQPALITASSFASFATDHPKGAPHAKMRYTRKQETPYGPNHRKCEISTSDLITNQYSDLHSPREMKKRDLARRRHESQIRKETPQTQDHKAKRQLYKNRDMKSSFSLTHI